MVFAYKELSARDVKKFITQLDKNNMNNGLNPDTTKVLSQMLSFSEKWSRLDCEDYSETPHIKRQYLSDGSVIVPFAYGPEPLKTVLNNVSLSLNQSNIVDYLTLYLTVFQKNGEKLTPVFHSDDIEWQDDLSPMLKKSLDIEFSKYPTVKENNMFSVEILCIFRQSIMNVECDIDQNGKVSIMGRSVIADNLPIYS
jgi:hypothetical protein